MSKNSELKKLQNHKLEDVFKAFTPKQYFYISASVILFMLILTGGSRQDKSTKKEVKQTEAELTNYTSPAYFDTSGSLVKFKPHSSRKGDKRFDNDGHKITNTAPVLIPRMQEQQSGVYTTAIELTCINIKNINGKFYYWFYIRNMSKTPFEGEVTIWTVTGTGHKFDDDFPTTGPIGYNKGSSCAVELSTGIPKFDGEDGIVGFQFVVRDKNGGIAQRGEGKIPNKLNFY